MCDSSAMVTLSRNRRCTRVLMVRRNHVAVAEMPKPIAATATRPLDRSRTPLPSSISQRASSASGSAATSARMNDTSINRGSWRYPSLHKRHIDESAGGSGSIGATLTLTALSEDVIDHPFFAFFNESFRLQIEHRSVATVPRHELVVRAEFDDAPVFEDTNAIGVTNR